MGCRLAHVFEVEAELSRRFPTDSFVDIRSAVEDALKRGLLVLQPLGFVAGACRHCVGARHAD